MAAATAARGLAYTTGSTPPSESVSHVHPEIALDILYLVMEALGNDTRSLKACSLVCYVWFCPARRYLFRAIHLRSSPIRRFTTSPDRPPPESAFPVYEDFCRFLDTLSDGHDLALELPERQGDGACSLRLKFDFRPFVEELRLIGESPAMMRRTLAIYPGNTWHTIIHRRLTQVLKVVNHFPKLRVLAFREARSFFSPTHHYNILWPVFWAFAARTEELRLENSSWSAGSLWGGSARIDLEEALGPPAVSGNCKIHTLHSDDLVSRDVDHFFGKLTSSGVSLPRFKSLRLPITVLEKSDFGHAIWRLGPHLRHLRFDLLSWRNCTFSPPSAFWILRVLTTAYFLLQILGSTVLLWI